MYLSMKSCRRSATAHNEPPRHVIRRRNEMWFRFRIRVSQTASHMHAHTHIYLHNHINLHICTASSTHILILIYLHIHINIHRYHTNIYSYAFGLAHGPLSQQPGASYRGSFTRLNRFQAFLDASLAWRVCAFINTARMNPRRHLCTYTSTHTHIHTQASFKHILVHIWLGSRASVPTAWRILSRFIESFE